MVARDNYFKVLGLAIFCLSVRFTLQLSLGIKSVPSGERIFYFLNKFQKKGLKIWRFCELPMKEKISSFIAVFVFFHGLSMKGKKLLRKFRELPRQMAVPVAYK